MVGSLKEWSAVEARVTANMLAAPPYNIIMLKMMSERKSERCVYIKLLGQQAAKSRPPPANPYAHAIRNESQWERWCCGNIEVLMMLCALAFFSQDDLEA